MSEPVERYVRIKKDDFHRPILQCSPGNSLLPRQAATVDGTCTCLISTHRTAGALKLRTVVVTTAQFVNSFTVTPERGRTPSPAI